jgi:hypothetical protein
VVLTSQQLKVPIHLRGRLSLGEEAAELASSQLWAISVVWATDSSHAYDRIDLDIFARDWRKNFLRIGFRIRFSPEVHRHRQDVRPVSLNGRRGLLYTWRSDWPLDT